MAANFSFPGLAIQALMLALLHRTGAIIRSICFSVTVPSAAVSRFLLTSSFSSCVPSFSSLPPMRPTVLSVDTECSVSVDAGETVPMTPSCASGRMKHSIKTLVRWLLR